MEDYFKVMQENEFATMILFVAVFTLLCGWTALIYGAIAVVLYTVFCFIMTYDEDDDDWFNPLDKKKHA